MLETEGEEGSGWRRKKVAESARHSTDALGSSLMDAPLSEFEVPTRDRRLRWRRKSDIAMV
jgi:hypothetical protein